MLEVNDETLTRSAPAGGSVRDDVQEAEEKTRLSKPITEFIFAELLLFAFVANVTDADAMRGRSTGELIILYALFGAGGIFALLVAVCDFVRWFKQRQKE